MKKYSLLFSFLILILSSNQATAIDTIGVKYYPLAAGNVWVYSSYTYPYGGYFRYRLKVTGTSVINNHLYYSVLNSGNNNTSSVRIDSANGNALTYFVSGCGWLFQDRLIDSLSARLNDSTSPNCIRQYKCSDTSSVTIFNGSRKKKSFYMQYFEGYNTRTYARGLGLISDYSAQHVNTTYVNLEGCVINGVVYGDTSMPVGINQISSEIPEIYSLSQNYPNPFNPATIIRFAIPSNVKSEMSNVKIIIYDVLGREVQTLINENISPGTYEFDFDGSNLTSGVYYYKLISDSFTETKRMVLMK